MTFLSPILNKVKPSSTIAINSKAKQMQQQGIDVVNLSSGEPDFPTPDHIKQAAKLAIDSNQTKYTPVDGTPALKTAIAEHLQQHFSLQYSPAEIVVGNGAKQNIFNLMLATLSKNDEVIIPAPYWVSYPDMVAICQATPIIVKANQANSFKLTAEQLKQAITPNTKMLLVNSPSNPSGSTYNQQELKQLAEVLLDHPNIIIVSDDIYAKVKYDDTAYLNIINVEPKLKNQTVVINGVSKAYAMTGWRIGYSAANTEISNAMRVIQSQSTSNPCSVSQAAAIAALSGKHQCVTQMVCKFKQRMEYLVKEINQIDGLSMLPAEGAFYAFINVKPAIKMKGLKDDLEFTEQLLVKAKVAGVPGSAFGLSGYLRLSFAESDSKLEQAVARIKQFMAE